MTALQKWQWCCSCCASRLHALTCRDGDHSIRIDVDAAEEPERAGPPPTAQGAAAPAQAGSTAADIEGGLPRAGGTAAHLEGGPPPDEQPAAEVQGPAHAGVLDADEAQLSRLAGAHAQLNGAAKEHAHLNGLAEPAPPEPDEERAAAAAVAHGLPKHLMPQHTDSLVCSCVMPCGPRPSMSGRSCCLQQTCMCQVNRLAMKFGLADAALALQHFGGFGLALQLVMYLQLTFAQQRPSLGCAADVMAWSY